MQTIPLNGAELIESAEEALAAHFKEIDAVAAINQRRVLESFRLNRLSEEFFAERTGYGRNDPGRKAIDEIFARVFQAEAAAVRMQLVSGTHAIAAALLGNVQPGDQVICLTGDPYDTLKEVIGLAGEEPGSLMSLGVAYNQIDLSPGDESDTTLRGRIQELVKPGRCLFYIQKSKGYTASRRSLSNQDIGRLAKAAHDVSKDAVVLVDNCYGEFVESSEPTLHGADLIAGSLIKNPGGGLAIAGGYIAGRERLVENALNRVTAPGVGGHQGLTYNQNRLILQGLFLAPSVVSQALKGAILTAEVFERLGLVVKPRAEDKRFDIIQTIEFGTPERLIAFCRHVQRWSPVNAHVVPEPALMPGYQDEVIMAAGTFVEGATLELSCDGPLRAPFAAFMQGGLTYLHVKCMLEEALSLSTREESPFL